MSRMLVQRPSTVKSPRLAVLLVFALTLVLQRCSVSALRTNVSKSDQAARRAGRSSVRGQAAASKSVASRDVRREPSFSQLAATAPREGTPPWLFVVAVMGFIVPIAAAFWCLTTNHFRSKQSAGDVEGGPEASTRRGLLQTNSPDLPECQTLTSAALHSHQTTIRGGRATARSTDIRPGAGARGSVGTAKPTASPPPTETIPENSLPMGKCASEPDFVQVEADEDDGTPRTSYYRRTSGARRLSQDDRMGSNRDVERTSRTLSRSPLRSAARSVMLTGSVAEARPELRASVDGVYPTDSGSESDMYAANSNPELRKILKKQRNRIGTSSASKATCPTMHGSMLGELTGPALETDDTDP